jgi:hypothetical protein
VSRNSSSTKLLIPKYSAAENGEKKGKRLKGEEGRETD